MRLCAFLVYPKQPPLKLLKNLKPCCPSPGQIVELQRSNPKGAKYLTTGHLYRVSKLGVEIMILGIYLMVGYLDP